MAVAVAISLTSALVGCSLLLREEPIQCKVDSDCEDRGFPGASCDLDGICHEPVPLSPVGDGDGDGGLGGSSTGGGGNTGGADHSSIGGGSMSGGGTASGGAKGAEPAIRAIGAAMTLLYGGTGSEAYGDACPLEQVLVGFNAWTNPGTAPGHEFVQQTQGICGRITFVDAEVVIEPGEILRVRGNGFTEGPEELTALACDAGEVVVGFDGRAGFYVEEIEMYCATLTLASDMEGMHFELGEARSAGTVFASDSGGDLFSARCPAGQVARGPAARAGGWIDAFGTVCTTPTISYPQGSPCADNDECLSGRCDEVCLASECEAPIGCECLLFNSKDYVFCPLSNLFSSAASACEHVGQELVKIQGPVENGWLRNTADILGIGEFYIGGSDSAVADEWTWRDGTTFWQGAAAGASVGNLYSFWDVNKPNGSGSCALVSAAPIVGGTWSDVPCTRSENFVCR